jgi:PDZ domain
MKHPYLRLIVFFALLIGLTWIGTPVQAQRGFFIPIGKRSVEVPFEYQNNLIVITLRLNGVLPLKFIYDTGAEHTILVQRELGDLIRLEYSRSFEVIGSDMSTVLTAWLARDVRMEVPGLIVAPQEDILVLEEDYFRFDEFLGVEVHGILAGHVLSRYIIKINYQRKVITLIERNAFIAAERKGFEPIPISILRTKPYLHTCLHLPGDSTLDVRLLMDTGASVPLMIFENTHPLLQAPSQAIPSAIGQGLGGEVGGFTGRIPLLELGSTPQRHVLTYFQTLDSVLLSSRYVARNGLIGNLVWSRFQVIIDYNDQKIWLKPTRFAFEAFKYDRSGLTLIAGGEGLRDYTVQYVLPGSPADEAGIRKGDQIIRIKHTPAVLMQLEKINSILQGKPGKRIPLTIRREGKKIKTSVMLRDLV